MLAYRAGECEQDFGLLRALLCKTPRNHLQKTDGNRKVHFQMFRIHGFCLIECKILSILTVPPYIFYINMVIWDHLDEKNRFGMISLDCSPLTSTEQVNVLIHIFIHVLHCKQNPICIITLSKKCHSTLSKALAMSNLRVIYLFFNFFVCRECINSCATNTLSVMSLS